MSLPVFSHAQNAASPKSVFFFLQPSCIETTQGWWQKMLFHGDRHRTVFAVYCRWKAPLILWDVSVCIWMHIYQSVCVFICLLLCTFLCFVHCVWHNPRQDKKPPAGKHFKVKLHTPTLCYPTRCFSMPPSNSFVLPPPSHPPCQLRWLGEQRSDTVTCSFSAVIFWGCVVVQNFILIASIFKMHCTWTWK